MHQTIMPCNKILVMDQGRIVQQGSPTQLIKEEGGKFQSLCKAAGDDEFQHLLSITEQASKA
jgi:ABC-type multidrug transport system fused ATPase/permease subunit